MRKNERLIGIRPYQTSTGDWHLICLTLKLAMFITDYLY